ncbi:helix-turn-helix domain-containing protein [Vannielia litorea]|uniref:helix-turn-helix domain-containing protein n=1 Tax=Vannielia litorea TaxID=1217970 RepID=UPI001BD0DF88|nr:helix-turn-helix transcriptional regulator [Vannielia litorea]MBS8225733.1 helix-turn-helix domain-containing protein [Vannielia litorea]
MLIIQDKFRNLLKRENLSLRKLARTSGVAERTLSRIKNGQRLQPGNVAKIAEALKSSVDELCSPTAKKDAGARDPNDCEFDLAAERFHVPVDYVRHVGCHLFVAVAEYALKRRREALETWFEDVQRLREARPRPETLRSSCPLDDADDIYEAELIEIDSCRLHTPGQDEDDHFFRALHDLGLEINFEGYGDSDTYSLQRLSYDIIVSDALWETLHWLAGAEGNYDSPLSQRAEDAILSGRVSIQELPIELKKPGKAFERSRWLASEGGKAELPDHLYHADRVQAALDLERWKDDVSGLRDKLARAPKNEQEQIAAELERAEVKLKHARAELRSGDEELLLERRKVRVQTSLGHLEDCRRQAEELEERRGSSDGDPQTEIEKELQDTREDILRAEEDLAIAKHDLIRSQERVAASGDQQTAAQTSARVQTLGGEDE